MTLNQAQVKTVYTVEKILESQEEITSRFYKIGIYPGVKITLKKKAPIFGDPMLFDVEGSHIALTKNEAKLLEVK